MELAASNPRRRRFERTDGAGESTEYEYGHALLSPDEIKFVVIQHLDRPPTFPISEHTRFTPVKWETHRYIIDTAGMEAFCKMVSEGKLCEVEFGKRYAMYSRVDRDTSPPRGVPEVPEKWAKAVLPVVVDH